MDMQKDKWLTRELREEIVKIFTKRYRRKLKSHEVLQIANGLTEGMEAILKIK